MHRSTWKILVAFSIIKYPKDEKGFKSNNDILNHNMLLAKIFSECTINFEQWRFSSVLPTLTGGIYLNSYLRELVTVLTAAERLHCSRSGVVTISCKDLDPSRPEFKTRNLRMRGKRFKRREIRRWRTNNSPHKDKYRHSDHNNDCNFVSYKIRFCHACICRLHT